MPLRDYIRGNKRGKEANRLEREAMNDPFLQEALEGLENVAGDHATIINRLEKKLTNPPAAFHINIHLILSLTIAASVLLLIVSGAYFILEKDNRRAPVLAELQSTLVVDTAEESNRNATADRENQTKPTVQAPAANENRESPLAASPVRNEHQANKALMNAVSQSDEKSTFGEKEFQTWCRQKPDKNVCAGKSAVVKVSFFIDETGKPSKIEYKKYSCEEAKKSVEHLLASSPDWTERNRRVTLTIKW